MMMIAWSVWKVIIPGRCMLGRRFTQQWTNEKEPVPGSSVRLKLMPPETVVHISNDAVAEGKNEEFQTLLFPQV